MKLDPINSSTFVRGSGVDLGPTDAKIDGVKTVVDATKVVVDSHTTKLDTLQADVTVIKTNTTPA